MKPSRTWRLAQGLPKGPNAASLSWNSLDGFCIDISKQERAALDKELEELNQRLLTKRLGMQLSQKVYKLECRSSFFTMSLLRISR